MNNTNNNTLFQNTEKINDSSFEGPSSSSTGTTQAAGRHDCLTPKRKRYGSTKRILPIDFKPTVNTVICGRGKESFASEGNQRFRTIVKGFLWEYKNTKGKLDKSFVVSKIVRLVQQQGEFVKFQNGKWFEVGDAYAREKVGALLRDFLQNKSSSSKAKKVYTGSNYTKQPKQLSPLLPNKDDHDTSVIQTPSPFNSSSTTSSRSNSSNNNNNFYPKKSYPTKVSIFDSQDHLAKRVYVSDSEDDSSGSHDVPHASFHDIDGQSIVIFANWIARER